VVKAAAAYAWGVKPAKFEMVSQMETEAASEDFTMVSFQGPLGCLRLGCWRSKMDKARCCRGGPWDTLGTWWKGAEEDNREAGKVGVQAAGSQAGPRGLMPGTSFDPPGQQIVPRPTGL
jgi:hypothetical protein